MNMNGECGGCEFKEKWGMNTVSAYHIFSMRSSLEDENTRLMAAFVSSNYTEMIHRSPITRYYFIRISVGWK